jgi:hypothetical protein
LRLAIAGARAVTRCGVSERLFETRYLDPGFGSQDDLHRKTS